MRFRARAVWPSPGAIAPPCQTPSLVILSTVIAVPHITTRPGRPAGTIRVQGERVCASVRGMPIEPCFNLNRTSTNAFRGSISGLGFAYCDFTRHRGRVTFTSAEPMPLSPEAKETPSRGLKLRPTLTAERN